MLKYYNANVCSLLFYYKTQVTYDMTYERKKKYT